MLLNVFITNNSEMTNKLRCVNQPHLLKGIPETQHERFLMKNKEKLDKLNALCQDTRYKTLI